MIPALLHLGVDTKTLLDERGDLIDGCDCSSIKVDRKGIGGSVSPLMIARIKRVTNDAVTDKTVTFTTSNVVFDTSKAAMRETTIDYYDVREEEDPFTGSSYLNPFHINQKEDIHE